MWDGQEVHHAFRSVNKKETLVGTMGIGCLEIHGRRQNYCNGREYWNADWINLVQAKGHYHVLVNTAMKF